MADLVAECGSCDPHVEPPADEESGRSPHGGVVDCHSLECGFIRPSGDGGETEEAELVDDDYSVV